MNLTELSMSRAGRSSTRRGAAWLVSGVPQRVRGTFVQKDNRGVSAAALMGEGDAGWEIRGAMPSGSGLLDEISAAIFRQRSLLRAFFVATMTCGSLRRHFAASTMLPRSLRQGFVATRLAQRSLRRGFFVAIMTCGSLLRPFFAARLGPRRHRLAVLAGERRGR
jgi:hypothetical protein